MSKLGTGRLKHLQEIAVIPLWRLGVYVAVTAVGTALTWRDLLVSKDNQRKWGLDVVPHWHWESWALGIAALVIVTLFEHSYRVRRRLEGERDAAQLASASLTQRQVEALERQVEAQEAANRRASLENSQAGAVIRAKLHQQEQAALGFFELPRQEWMPLHTLPFRLPFDPRFASLTHVVTPELCNRVLTSSGDFSRFTLANGYELTEATVLWKEERVLWRWRDPTDENRELDLSYKPWEYETISLGFSAAIVGPVWESIKYNTYFVWNTLRSPIWPLIETGAVRLWARAERATAPFSAVAPDVWHHYSVEDWDSGRARGPDGQMLFSLYADLTPSASSASQR